MEQDKKSQGVGVFLRKVYMENYPHNVFIALFIMFLSASIFFMISQGLFVTDEAVYFLTAKSFADNGSFEIWNGLDEINSSALRFTNLMSVSNGKLYGQYPPLHAIISYPFYKVFGFYGLFLMNFLSFSASMIILYSIIVRVFDDRFLAAASVVAFSLFTYALEFSIELWPHMISVAMVLLSLRLALSASRKSIAPFIAGLVSASAVGVRYQEIVFSLLLFSYLLLKRDSMKLISFTAGLAIPLILLLSINYSIYGMLATGYSDMDSNFSSYGYFHFAILAVMLSASYLLYPRLKLSFGARKSLCIIALSFALALLLFQAADSSWTAKLRTSMQVAYSEVFDLSSFPTVEVYEGKKSLLQAAPFLILALFALPEILKSGAKRDFKLLFIAFSISEIVFFSSVVRQHGQTTTNMRFFLESLPFLATLSIYTIAGFIKSLSSQEKKASFLVSMSSLLIFLYVIRESVVFELNKVFPLLLALSLVAFHITYFKTNSKNARLFYLFLLAVVFSYSFFTSLTELTVSQASRAEQKVISDYFCGQIAEDSIVVYQGNIPLVPLAPTRLCKNARFAMFEQANKEEVIPLLEFYSNRNVAIQVLDKENDPKWTLFWTDAKEKYPLSVIQYPPAKA